MKPMYHFYWEYLPLGYSFINFTCDSWANIGNVILQKVVKLRQT